jgi:hypothetical protein
MTDTYQPWVISYPTQSSVCARDNHQRQGCTSNAPLSCCALHPQDDIYQPWEDQLPYSEFSVRLPHSSIPDIVPLLSEVSDEDYLQLRAGLVKHWRAFVWDKAIGGTAVSAAAAAATAAAGHLKFCAGGKLMAQAGLRSRFAPCLLCSTAQFDVAAPTHWWVHVVCYICDAVG